MAEFIKHTSCDKCGSSDARAVYEDGGAYCFSCNEYSGKKGGSKNDFSYVLGYDTRGIAERKITKVVAEFFGMKVAYDEDGDISRHFYPYQKDGDLVGWKVRSLPKTFSAIGSTNGADLFGQCLFQGGGRKLVITEGELDAMAVAQSSMSRWDRVYPVVSLPNGAAADKAILANREWVRSFDEVILMLDQDDAGKVGLERLATVIGMDKVKIAKLPAKDPCDVLYMPNGGALIQTAIFEAESWNPAGIMVGEKIWDEFNKRRDVSSVPYPPCLDGLNEKLWGMRTGEITLFTSGTGTGKTTVTKEIILNLLETTDAKIGVMSLEESVGDTATQFISMKLKKAISGPDADEYNEAEAREAFDSVFGDGRVMLLDHQGSVADGALMEMMEFMCLSGCKYIILDHLTIAASQGNKETKDPNAATDALLSDILKMVKRHDVWVGAISHLRKTGSGGSSFEEGGVANMDDIKGSASTKQICFDVIYFSRNQGSDDLQEKNTVDFRVLKARFSGNTGAAGSAYYDPETRRLTACDAYTSFEALDVL